MEKDKSRGIKHMKDKKKYKGNSVKNAKYVPAKNKPNLGSNWDRYETEAENEHEHKLSSSTDFALLSNIPISTGSHFQFKKDKILEENETENVNLFCLDLDLLHKSILTVPFYDRLCIEKDYFKKFEVNKMDMEAQKHLSDYNEFIQNKNLNSNIVQTQNLSEKSQDDLSNASGDEEENISELIDNCNIREAHKVTTAVKTHDENSSKHDLEQWLDDLLED